MIRLEVKQHRINDVFFGHVRQAVQFFVCLVDLSDKPIKHVFCHTLHARVRALLSHPVP